MYWFCHTSTCICHSCTHVPNPEPPSLLPPHPITLDSPSALALSALFYASNLDWASISHMVLYIFQCCSLKSSHPRLLPQSPKVCYLCVSFAVSHHSHHVRHGHRYHLSKFHIYVLTYCIGVFLSGLLHSV